MVGNSQDGRKLWGLNKMSSKEVTQAAIDKAKELLEFLEVPSKVSSGHEPSVYGKAVPIKKPKVTKDKTKINTDANLSYAGEVNEG